MKMVRAVVKPENVDKVLNELKDAGYPSVSKLDIVGRGKQRGVKVGDVHYDQLPKEMLIMVVEDEIKDDVVSVILNSAKTDKGVFGDGKIFVSDVSEAYTISSGKMEL